MGMNTSIRFAAATLLAIGAVTATTATGAQAMMPGPNMACRLHQPACLLSWHRHEFFKPIAPLPPRR